MPNTNPGIDLQVTFIYYKDLDEAIRFYEDVMGFKLAIDQGWSKIYHVTGNAHIGLVEEKRGRFNNESKKTNQICLRVPDVDAWHQFLKSKGVDNLTDPTESKELKIRAFVLYDPGEYEIEIQEAI